MTVEAPETFYPWIEEVFTRDGNGRMLITHLSSTEKLVELIPFGKNHRGPDPALELSPKNNLTI